MPQIAPGYKTPYPVGYQDGTNVTNTIGITQTNPGNGFLIANISVVYNFGALVEVNSVQAQITNSGTLDYSIEYSLDGQNWFTIKQQTALLNNNHVPAISAFSQTFSVPINGTYFRISFQDNDSGATASLTVASLTLLNHTNTVIAENTSTQYHGIAVWARSRLTLTEAKMPDSFLTLDIQSTLDSLYQVYPCLATYPGSYSDGPDKRALEEAAGLYVAARVYVINFQAGKFNRKQSQEGDTNYQWDIATSLPIQIEDTKKWIGQAADALSRIYCVNVLQVASLDNVRLFAVSGNRRTRQIQRIQPLSVFTEMLNIVTDPPILRGRTNM